MFPEPGEELRIVRGPRFQEGDQEAVRRAGLDVKLHAIQSQEHVGREEGHALVAVDEGVVHQQRLEERCRHLDDVAVVPRLGAVERALEAAQIADARGPAEGLKGRRMDGERLVQGEEQDRLTWQAGGRARRSR